MLLAAPQQTSTLEHVGESGCEGLQDIYTPSECTRRGEQDLPEDRINAFLRISKINAELISNALTGHEIVAGHNFGATNGKTTRSSGFAAVLLFCARTQTNHIFKTPPPP